MNFVAIAAITLAAGAAIFYLSPRGWKASHGYATSRIGPLIARSVDSSPTLFMVQDAALVRRSAGDILLVTLPLPRLEPGDTIVGLRDCETEWGELYRALSRNAPASAIRCAIDNLAHTAAGYLVTNTPP